jgi:hypothetical protein
MTHQGDKAKRPARRNDVDNVRVYTCANCHAPLTGPDAVSRGPDTAWHGQCQECYELSQDQIELVYDEPDGAPIQIHQCRRCGDLRACRRGWRTRCHVCLDGRTSQTALGAASEHCLALFSEDPLLALRVGRNLNLERGEPITPRVIVEATSCLTVATQVARFERPGWTVVGADVWGLPWRGLRSRSVSHGTWGRHDACGAIAKLRAGAVDCPTCGPQPDSRTHRARQDEPYFLYQVKIKGLTKFGVGTVNRVRTHERGGATVVQVLRAPFAEVVLAERMLKTAHAAHILNRRTRRMPGSFGMGTEVLSRHMTIDLADALPGGEDVTSWFGTPQ